MRIVGGQLGGRVLRAPSGAAARPTSEKVREAVFDILGSVTESRVLDLFAGTGALALEALSRGARSAVLVDSDRGAVRLIRANAEALGFGDRTRIIAAPVARALKLLQREGARFDLIFADPPYAARAVLETLGEIEAAALCKPGGRVCIEHDKRETAPESGGLLSRIDQRRFGDTVVSIYRVS